MKLDIRDLKRVLSKLSYASEKSMIDPKSGWLELISSGNNLVFKISNTSNKYYIEANLQLSEAVDNFHVTVESDNFISLISKLDDYEIELEEKYNVLILTTNNSEYSFPLIKESGRTKELSKIPFEDTDASYTLLSEDLYSVVLNNLKNLTGSVVQHGWQQYIYIDSKGSVINTDNMVVNNFRNQTDDNWSMCLTASQAGLLQIFKDDSVVNLEFNYKPSFDDNLLVQSDAIIVKLYTDEISIIMTTATRAQVSKFPATNIRLAVNSVLDTHVVVDKKLLDKALARLMIFDKKFDATILDYSRLEFKQDELVLVSVKNRNFEKIPYESSTNAFEHNSVIRFADLARQIKFINSKEIDISYGTKPLIAINNDNVKQLIPEVVMYNKT